MRGLDENGNNADTAQVSGYLHVAEINALQAEVIEAAREKHPSLTIEYDTVRKFVVKFYNGDTLLQTVSQIDYGGSAAYTGTTPTKEAADASEEWRFMGWDKDTSYVTGDMDVYAVFGNVALKAIKLVERTLSGEYVNDSAEYICDRAFHGIAANSATFTALATVGADAFANSGTQKVSAPVATLVESNAFQYWGGTEASFPKVKTLNKWAFQRSSLVNADFPEAETLVGRVFYGSKVTSANLPKVKTIGDYSFYGTPLTSVYIPAVTELKDGAFNGCSQLPMVDLPATMTNKLCNLTFDGCKVLTTLVIRSETPVAMAHTNVLTNTPIASGTGYVYVPAALVDSYKAATNWSTYADQIRAIEDYPDITGG